MDTSVPRPSSFPLPSSSLRYDGAGSVLPPLPPPGSIYGACLSTRAGEAKSARMMQQTSRAKATRRVRRKKATPPPRPSGAVRTASSRLPERAPILLPPIRRHRFSTPGSHPRAVAASSRKGCPRGLGRNLTRADIRVVHEPRCLFSSHACLTRPSTDRGGRATRAPDRQTPPASRHPRGLVYGTHSLRRMGKRLSMKIHSRGASPIAGFTCSAFSPYSSQHPRQLFPPQYLLHVSEEPIALQSVARSTLATNPHR